VHPIISVSDLTKTYASGFQALKEINLRIWPGEIFALLGPNGAGKTTLIGIICGIVNPTRGVVMADGHDVINDYRAARSKIGLVPQELSTDSFETVWATVNFSRGLFGKAANRDYIEKVLKDLSLWDRKDSKILTLSGGMKRRVMIAKALSHEPRILFLDEPTAGVDVELRRDMWEMVRSLRATYCTFSEAIISLSVLCSSGAVQAHRPWESPPRCQIPCLLMSASQLVSTRYEVDT
jgi:ABC-2 type transport system ATP-binding protein